MKHSGYQQLEGTYTRVLRSASFKTKGLILHSDGQELEIFLPKKLRLLLALELQPGDRLRLLTETKQQKTIAINIMKLTITDDDRCALTEPDVHRSNPTETQPDRSDPGVMIEICRKGTCRKRGSLELLKQWQAEAERDPTFTGVEFRLTGCLKRCKSGVNVCIGDRIVSHAQTMNLTAIVC